MRACKRLPVSKYDEEQNSRKNKIKNCVFKTGVLLTLAAGGFCLMKDSKVEPVRTLDYINQDFSQIDKYTSQAIKDDKVVKVYKADNVYILYDDNFVPHEYIYNYEKQGFVSCMELYDLRSEELLAYDKYDIECRNIGYYNELVLSNNQICLKEICNYVPEAEVKDYYTLEEITELEKQALENVQKYKLYVKPK